VGLGEPRPGDYNPSLSADRLPDFAGAQVSFISTPRSLLGVSRRAYGCAVASRRHPIRSGNARLETIMREEFGRRYANERESLGGT